MTGLVAAVAWQQWAAAVGRGSVAGRARALATLLGLGQLRSRRKLGRQRLWTSLPPWRCLIGIHTRLLQVKTQTCLTQTCLGWHRSLPKRDIKHLQNLGSASSGWFLFWFSFSPWCFAPIQLAMSCCLGCVNASCLVMSSWASCGARHC